MAAANGGVGKAVRLFVHNLENRDNTDRLVLKLWQILNFVGVIVELCSTTMRKWTNSSAEALVSRRSVEHPGMSVARDFTVALPPWISQCVKLNINLTVEAKPEKGSFGRKSENAIKIIVRGALLSCLTQRAGLDMQNRAINECDEILPATVWFQNSATQSVFLTAKYDRYGDHNQRYDRHVAENYSVSHVWWKKSSHPFVAKLTDLKMEVLCK